MQIQWLGQSFFKIQIKNNGSEVIIATDPYDQSCGLKPSKFNADILTISHDHADHNNVDAIKGDPFIIDGPGEYETKGVFIYGIDSWHDDSSGTQRGSNTIYHITAEGINLVHLGDLGHELTDKQLERMNSVDILMIPVGGIYSLDAKKANDVISQIEPRIIIPMHYQIPGLKLSQTIDEVEKFLKASGLPTEKMDKYKIAKKDLPSNETKIVLLNP